MEAIAKSACSTCQIGMSMVLVRMAVCRVTEVASTTTRPMAAQAAMRAVRRTMSAPSTAVSGRAASSRNSVPPSAMDCATMASPCRMMPR
jgi:hypothetical protein